MPTVFIHHVDTATALQYLTGMFNQKFGCLKSHFRSKLSCKGTSIPRIIVAVLAYIGYNSSFSWRPTCFRRSCVGLLKPAKYGIKTGVKISYSSFYEGKEYCTGVMYWGEGGKVVRWEAKCMSDRQFLFFSKTQQHTNFSTFRLFQTMERDRLLNNPTK